MRLLLLAVWLAVLIVALLPLLRRRLPGRPPRPITSDELVKDPVCQTYVVRSRAVTRQTAGGARYFCSPECAGRFLG